MRATTHRYLERAFNFGVGLRHVNELTKAHDPSPLVNGFNVRACVHLRLDAHITHMQQRSSELSTSRDGHPPSDQPPPRSDPGAVRRVVELPDEIRG